MSCWKCRRLVEGLVACTSEDGLDEGPTDLLLLGAFAKLTGFFFVLALLLLLMLLRCPPRLHFFFFVVASSSPPSSIYILMVIMMTMIISRHHHRHPHPHAHRHRHRHPHLHPHPPPHHCHHHHRHHHHIPMDRWLTTAWPGRPALCWGGTTAPTAAARRSARAPLTGRGRYAGRPPNSSNLPLTEQTRSPRLATSTGDDKEKRTACVPCWYFV